MDENQRIESIGLTIKLIVDQRPEVKEIASGSSSSDLTNKINEPLTGRKWEYNLHPFSFQELVTHYGIAEEERLLEPRPICGAYPEVRNRQGDEKECLKELASNFLFKDILTWERINKPDRLERLVQALALQIGREISYNEIGQLVALDNETVGRYTNLLEKIFVVFRLYSFNRNHRNELKKTRKLYFHDNGLRNAIIDNFSYIGSRNDKGALWENHKINERKKYLDFSRNWASSCFWRTPIQQEIDYVEEYDGQISRFEFKWHPKDNVGFPSTLKRSFPNSVFSVTHKGIVEDFLIDKDTHSTVEYVGQA